MTETLLTSEFRGVLRYLRLSPMKETLPERVELAKRENIPYHTFLELVLTDEMERRQRLSALNRSKRASLDREMTQEKWDESSKVTFDRRLFSELTRLRFIEEHHHVLLLGPVGVGKTFLANALGHIACRRGYSVLMMRAEKMLKTLKASRLDQTYDAEMRRLIHVALLIVDDLGLDQIDADGSRDLYEIIVERHRRGSMLVTSNREPQEWLSTMTDPLRAQSAIDRLQNAAYELVIEGESYRKRQKPRLDPESAR
jgi:DNA replication protein DnaC